MLEDAFWNSFEHIVSWVPNTRGYFIVKEPDTFVSSGLLGKYFARQNHYKSFQRQLSLYNFKRCTTGMYRGAYSHPMFQRGNITLLYDMTRTKIKKKKKSKQQQNDATATTNSTKVMIQKQTNNKTSTTTIIEESSKHIQGGGGGGKQTTAATTPPTSVLKGVDIDCDYLKAYHDSWKMGTTSTASNSAIEAGRGDGGRNGAGISLSFDLDALEKVYDSTLMMGGDFDAPGVVEGGNSCGDKSSCNNLFEEMMTMMMTATSTTTTATTKDELDRSSSNRECPNHRHHLFEGPFDDFKDDIADEIIHLFLE